MAGAGLDPDCHVPQPPELRMFITGPFPGSERGVFGDCAVPGTDPLKMRGVRFDALT